MLMSPIKRLARINEYIQAGLAAAGSVFRLIDQPEESDSGVDTGKVLSGSVVLLTVVFWIMAFPQLVVPSHWPILMMVHLSLELDLGFVSLLI